MQEFVIDRVFVAPRDVVFRAFTAFRIEGAAA